MPNSIRGDSLGTKDTEPTIKTNPRTNTNAHITSNDLTRHEVISLDSPSRPSSPVSVSSTGSSSIHVIETKSSPAYKNRPGRRNNDVAREGDVSTVEQPLNLPTPSPSLPPSYTPDSAPRRSLLMHHTSQNPKKLKSSTRQESKPTTHYDEYSQMYAEAGSSASTTDRPLKRRRIRPDSDHVNDSVDEEKVHVVSTSVKGLTAQQKPKSQIYTYITDDTSGEDDDGSDIEWEAVDLSGLDASRVDAGRSNNPPLLSNTIDPTLSDDTMHITLQPSTPSNTSLNTTTRKKRPSITHLVRTIRLCVHKIHLQCMLYHVYLVNRRLANRQILTSLAKLVSPKILSLFRTPHTMNQYQRQRNFIDGLKNLVDLWRKKWTVTVAGCVAPKWRSLEDLHSLNLQVDPGTAQTRQSLADAAVGMAGSRDVGAQLFAALLRSIGIEARLVASLQVLPVGFGKEGESGDASSSVAKKIASLVPPPESINRRPSDELTSDDGEQIPRDLTSGRTVLPSTLRHRQQPQFRASSPSPSRLVNPIITNPISQQTSHHPIDDSPYPVFWTEAFDPTSQRYIPVDALATHLVDKPHKLEPPQADPRNTLAYVVGFDDDGYVHEVTRRYAKSYSAKTRKLRVEGSSMGSGSSRVSNVVGPKSGGAEWWTRVLETFTRPETLNREAIEEQELARAHEKEGMPTSIVDFKDHPLFVLERHLRKDQIVQEPKLVVSLFTSGRGKSQHTEEVYRRQDVRRVRTAVGWYRLGRMLKNHQDPLKYTQPKGSRVKDDEEEDDDDTDDKTTPQGMYAESQTSQYKSPPVVNGMLPKNDFGNIEIFKPWMVPEGAAHIVGNNNLLRAAAKMLEIDHAPAVTGFDFTARGRRVTPVTQGIVIAAEYKEALEVVLHAVAEQQAEEAQAAKDVQVAQRWKRLLTGLFIKQRLTLRHGDAQDLDEHEAGKSSTSCDSVDADSEVDTAGTLPLREETNETGNDDNSDETDGDTGGGFFR